MFYCLGTGPHNFFARQIIYKACSSGVEGVLPNPISSLVPSMGPLHVDLNADEDIVTNDMPFMNPSSPEKGWLTNQNHGELDSFLK